MTAHPQATEKRERTLPVNLRTSLRLNNDLPVSTFVDLAVRAENAGFDQVWVSHDLFLRSAPVLLAAAAVADADG